MLLIEPMKLLTTQIDRLINRQMRQWLFRVIMEVVQCGVLTTKACGSIATLNFPAFVQTNISHILVIVEMLHTSVLVVFSNAASVWM